MTDNTDDDNRGRGPRGRAPGRPTRNGRPSAPRGDDRRSERSSGPRAGADRPPRRPRDEEGRGGSERPQRRFQNDEGRGGSERPPRRFQKDEGRGGSDRPVRRSRDDEGRTGAPRPPRRFDSDRAGSSGERPARRFNPAGDRAGGERPQRRFRDDEGRAPSRRPARDDRPPRPRREASGSAVAEIEAAPAVEAQEPTEERIAKVMARAGVASRRDAEVLIAEGRVTLNGEVVTSPALNVTRDDVITVDGEPLPERERTRLWLFHKPRGVVTTAKDPEGRPTVFDNLPEDLPRVVSIGRLDINTEGLLLLTNDGGLAKVIAHPDTGWLRRYRVRAHGDITQDLLDGLRHGITIDGIEYGPVEARIDRVQGDNTWITMGLREGKNREIKRILEHLGVRVNRLIRLSFGPFQLGDLEEGVVEEVKTKVLRDQLGTALAEQAGVDFQSPVREPIKPFGSKPEPAGDKRGVERRERDDERPLRDRKGGDRERPARGRGERDRPERERGGTRSAPRREPHGTVWRAEEAEGEERPAKKKAPRRGADPKEARTVSAVRPRERVGATESVSGRRVLVERLVSEPKPEAEEAPARKPRAAAKAPRADATLRRPSARGERPEREGGFGRSEGRSADRPPRRPREDGDRPARAFGDRPPRGAGPGRSAFGERGGFRSDRDGERPARPSRFGTGERSGGFGRGAAGERGEGRSRSGGFERGAGGERSGGGRFGSRDGGERSGGFGRGAGGERSGAPGRGRSGPGGAERGERAPRSGPGGAPRGDRAPRSGGPGGAPRGDRAPRSGAGGPPRGFGGPKKGLPGGSRGGPKVPPRGGPKGGGRRS